MEPELLAWEKQRGESAKAFSAFVLYRDLRAERSLTKVVRILYETGTPTSRSQLGEWSARWNWVERADAFDRDEDKVAREEHQRTIGEARRAEAMAGTLMLGAAIRRLTGDADTREGEGVITLPLNLNGLGAGDVARLADVGSKLLDKGLGIAPDLRGLTSVSGRSVYDLARGLLMLSVDALEEAMRASVGANGNLDALIAFHQEKLIEDAGTLYTRTTP
jgi:hypothetical protein